MKSFITLLWVGAGGFIGSAGRYLLNLAIGSNYTGDFPLPTFLINISGCLLLGIITEITGDFLTIKPEIKLFLTVGICGGFTTFSTFIFENYQILKDTQYYLAILYSALSFILGFIALYSGILLVRILFK